MIERRIGAVVGAPLTVFFYRLASHRRRKDKRMVRRWRMAKRAFSYCVKIRFSNQANLQLEINRTTVAKLRNRDYTFVDLPESEHHFVGSVFPHTGAFRSGLQLKAGQTRFLLV